MDATKAIALVVEIAENSPNEPYDEINACRYCQNSWTERDYDEWLKKEAIIAEYPERPKFDSDHVTGASYRRWYNATTDHHDKDCLWIRCNQLVRES